MHRRLVTCALLAMLAMSVHADPRDAVGWGRAHGCSNAHSTAQEAVPLHAAAARLAAGAGLNDALAAVGYLAARSAAVHISGAANDVAAGQMLSSHYCNLLADPALTEFGALRRGGDLWFVFAKPALVPLAADAAGIARRVLGLVNQARARGQRCGAKYFSSAPPLILNAALGVAALAHSTAMARYQEFDHRGHDGSSPALRVEQAGYGLHSLVGENIAAGVMTPAEVTQGWLDSPAHCENIMDPRFRDMGLGFAVNAAAAEGVYWTQDFAAPRYR